MSPSAQRLEHLQSPCPSGLIQETEPVVSFAMVPRCPLKAPPQIVTGYHGDWRWSSGW